MSKPDLTEKPAYPFREIKYINLDFQADTEELPEFLESETAEEPIIEMEQVEGPAKQNFFQEIMDTVNTGIQSFLALFKKKEPEESKDKPETEVDPEQEETPAPEESVTEAEPEVTPPAAEPVIEDPSTEKQDEIETDSEEELSSLPEEGKEPPEISMEAAPEEKKEEEYSDLHSEEMPSGVTEKPVKEKQSRKKVSVRKVFKNIKILVVLCLVLGITIPIFVTVRRHQTVNAFNDLLEEQKYTDAVEIYKKHEGQKKFVSKANNKVCDAIVATVTAYAKDEIDAGTANSVLQDLSQFPGVARTLAEQMDRAKSLEISKNSFIAGKQYLTDGNYLQGLAEWKKVVSEDTNYVRVQESINTYKEDYKLNGLIQCIEYKKGNQPERYRKGIELLFYWFPDDKSISDEIKLLTKDSGGIKEPEQEDTASPFNPFHNASKEENGTSEQVVVPESNFPIHIEKLQVGLPNAEGQGGRDLKIIFTNISGKIIKKIIFVVTPMDGNNNPMSCNRRGYTKYMAEIDQSIQNNETFGENSSWPSAWYNSMIDHVTLDQVIIEYQDGTHQDLGWEQANKLFEIGG